MSEAIGVALVVAALAPFTFGAKMQALLDRDHRRRTGRSRPAAPPPPADAPARDRGDGRGGAGALLVALTH